MVFQPVYPDGAIASPPRQPAGYPNVVIIAGTAAIKPLAGVYYRLLMMRCGAQIFSLRHFGLASLQRASADFERWAEHHLDPDKPTILVGHSQGALIAVLYAAAHPEVKLVIAASGPFGGTLTALLIAATRAGRDMLPGSHFLESVKRALPSVVDRLITVGAAHEFVVVPPSSCRVAGARHIQLGTNHLTEILDPKLWALIRRERDIILAAHVA